MQGSSSLTNQQSSPRIPAEGENASKANVKPTTIIDEAAEESQAASQLSARLDLSLPIDGEACDSETIDQPPPNPVTDRTDDESTTFQNATQIRRDGRGSLRQCKGGKEHLPADFEEEHRKVLKGIHRKTMMDEDSPKSSLSPTQANSESAYHPYHQGLLVNPFSSKHVVQDEESEENRAHRGRESLGWKQDHSMITDSTAYTYGENDTGHVDLFPSAPKNQETHGTVSQDASFTSRSYAHSQPFYEPRTPAPVNPFSEKGSVMKGHEMFGATQPSSIGRNIPSSTSSRPSPDVYSNSSPQKRMTTSPLERHGNEISILQSSVRTILRSKSASSFQPAETLPMTSSRSFGYQSTRREPRDTYISTKESQERRQQDYSPSDSTTDSDAETEAIKRERARRRAARDARAQKELAQVTSSRPGSGTSGDIEVPASGARRLSVEEDDIAQRNGIDTRDQQHDVITDSQEIVREPEAIDLPEDAASSEVVASHLEVERTVPPKSSPQLPARRASVEPHRVPDLYSTSQTEEVSSPSKDPALLAQPSLPLQEVSTNRHLKTPIGCKVAQVLSDGADTIIPNTILETSPLGEDRIRPMGEVTSFSFPDNTYDDDVIAEAPGFTQDIEFDNAINPSFSPTPPPKSRSKGFPSFEQSATAAQGAIVSKESSHSGVSRPEVSDNTAVVVSLDKPQNNAVCSEGQTSDAPQAEAVTVKETIAISDDDQGAGPVGEHDKHPIEASDSVELFSRPPKRKSAKTAPKQPKEPLPNRGGLRSKEELKGPSKALRRSNETTTPTSQQAAYRATISLSAAKIDSARSSKHVSDASSVMSTPLSSLGSTPVLESTPAPSVRSSTRKKNATIRRVDDSTPAPALKIRKPATQAPPPKEETPILRSQHRSSRRSNLQAKENRDQIPASAVPARSLKRKSAVSDHDEPVITRAYKRQSITQLGRDSSDDLLASAAATPDSLTRVKNSNKLFSKMAFAVSYVKQEQEKSHVVQLITEQGGRILDDGFQKLFESVPFSRPKQQAGIDNAELSLTAAANSIGFMALIADDHSRKAKYMQALALGLPCISGRWVLTCVAKGEVVNWIPYLLCAGQSTFLGNATRSRTLAPYSATEARLPDTLASRENLLEGKSVLLVTAKGKEDTRKAYVFLTLALGPARIAQVSDHEQARKKLVDDDTWDLLYVDKNEAAAEAAVFGSSASTSSGSKKRKRGPVVVEEVATPAPKRIRVINDETIIQSLIFGQLLED